MSGPVARRTRWSRAWLAGGLAATVALAVAAKARHLQGDVHRGIPHLIAAGVVWTIVAGAIGHRRAAAVVVACSWAAGVLWLFGLYVFFFVNIDDECPPLAQELTRAGCRERARFGFIAVMVLLGAALIAAAIWIGRRRSGSSATARPSP